MNDHRAVGTSAGLRRTLIAVVTVVAVVMSTAFGLRQLPSASADPVDVTISNVSITGTGDDIVDGNVVDVRMNWAANGPFKEGDTFSVKFPSNFPPQPIASFDLIDEAGVSGGTCSVAQGQQVLVCTLNNEYVNKNDVKGVIGLRAQADGESTDETYPFKVTGKQVLEVPAKVPGGVKAKGTIDVYNPVGALEKSAHVAALTDEYLIWDILIPYETFKDTDKFTVVDTIKGTNHKHVEAWDPKTNQKREGATQQARDNSKTPVGADFARTDNKLTVTLYRPETGWLEGQDIYLTYWTQRLVEVTKDGDDYSNSVSVDADGETTSANADVFWNTDGFGTIEGGVRTTLITPPPSTSSETTKPSEPTESSPSSTTTPSEPSSSRTTESSSSSSTTPSEPSSSSSKTTEPTTSETTSSSSATTSASTTSSTSSTTTRPNVPGVPFVPGPGPSKSPEPSAPGTPSSTPSSTTSSSSTTTSTSPTPPTTPKTPGDTPEGSSEVPWWLLLIPLIPLVPAVIWFLGTDGSSQPAPAPAPAPLPAPAPAPAPGQPAPAPAPAPGQPAPAPAPAPGKPAQHPAKPGERKEIKSVPSGATELVDGVARFVA